MTDLDMGMARRIPIEQPPSEAAEADLKRQRDAFRVRVGQNLRDARIQAGLTQVQLGVRANVSGNYVGQAELGRRGVTIDFLMRIAYYLAIPVRSLLD
jgi:DNA-binding XRE family transcriptional regulator